MTTATEEPAAPPLRAGSATNAGDRARRSMIELLAGFRLSSEIGRFLRPLLVAVSVFAAVSVAVPAFQDHPRDQFQDFKYNYAASLAWTQGKSPYQDSIRSVIPSITDPAYYAAYGGDIPHAYFYPPHSIVLAPLGLFDFERASLAWAALSLFCLALASVLFSRLVQALYPRVRTLDAALLHWAAVCLGWQATFVVIEHNNVSFLIYAGVMASLLGAATKRQGLLAVGLFTAMLRPQIGLALLVCALLRKPSRGGALMAAGAIGVGCLFGLAPEGVVQSGMGFLQNVAGYGAFPENHASAVSGAGHAVYRAFGVETGALIWLAPALAFIGALAVRARNEAGSPREEFDLFASAILIGLALLPSHNNYCLAAFPALLLFNLSAAGRIAAALCLAALMRSWDVAIALKSSGIGDYASNVATVDTIAILAVSVVCAASSVRKHRSAQVEAI